MDTRQRRLPLDEQMLVQRTQAARARGALDAAILFGSRARGDHHAGSDWDVCIIGGSSNESAIEAIQGNNADADWRIDMLWAATDAALREAAHGTVWARIVEEGRVIAGDPTMLRKLTIKAMEAETVNHRLGQTIRKLRNGIRASIGQAEENQTDRRDRMSDGTEDSANAAQGLTWVLAGFAEMGQASPQHTIFDQPARWQEKANLEGVDPRQAQALACSSRRIEAMNGGTRAARGAGYEPGKVEEQSVWERRLVKVMQACADLFEGTLAGRGPLGALREHAEKHRLRAVLGSRAAQAAGMVKTLLGTHPDQCHKGVWLKAKSFGERCERASTLYTQEMAAARAEALQSQNEPKR